MTTKNRNKDYGIRVIRYVLDKKKYTINVQAHCQSPTCQHLIQSFGKELTNQNRYNS
jgi:hypothetical protein